MEYITTKEASQKWGISTSRITLLANEGRIPGAQRLGKSWLIPASATKPAKLKAGHSASVVKEADHFSFPLYHSRPDWSSTKEGQLSKQQKSLLRAETAVMECRFADAYPLLESILLAPDDNITEAGCLWHAGICCIALNKPADFTRIYLRLQMLLSEDFPHRDDLVIILDLLKTYVETVDSYTSYDACNTDIHDQSLPLTCMMIGYVHLSKEILRPRAADTTLLELNLRLLKNTSAIVVIEMMHCYLLGIYCMRQKIEAAEKHAKAVVQIAFENKYYLPLVTYYRYYTQILDPILAQYPKEFQDHCHMMFSQYEKNFTGFISSLYENNILSKFTAEDYSYVYAILMQLTNAEIADKLGVHIQTVKNKLAKLFKKLGVENKKQLREYLINNM